MTMGAKGPLVHLVRCRDWCKVASRAAPMARVAQGDVSCCFRVMASHLVGFVFQCWLHRTCVKRVVVAGSM